MLQWRIQKIWFGFYLFPNEFLKIRERLLSGQQSHFGSTVEALIFTNVYNDRMSKRERDWSF